MFSCFIQFSFVFLYQIKYGNHLASNRKSIRNMLHTYFHVCSVFLFFSLFTNRQRESGQAERSFLFFSLSQYWFGIRLCSQGIAPVERLWCRKGRSIEQPGVCRHCENGLQEGLREARQCSFHYGQPGGTSGCRRTIDAPVPTGVEEQRFLRLQGEGS